MGDVQRVGADEQVDERVEAVHRVARADADDPLVGLDPHDRGREAAARDGVPGGREGRVQREHQAVQPDRGDAHVRQYRRPGAVRYGSGSPRAHRRRPPAGGSQQRWSEEPTRRRSSSSTTSPSITTSSPKSSAGKGTPGRGQRSLAAGAGRQDLLPRRPVGLRQDDVAQDGQPAHRADVRADPHRRRRRLDPRADGPPPQHRLRHPAGRALPASDHRRQRRDRAAADGLDQGPPARALRGAAGPRRPGRRQVPRPVPEPAVRWRATARRRRPGASRGPADHAHGRALRGGRSDRPGPAPERIPSPPGDDRQDDPVRDPRHRRGDQDGRPRRGLPDRRDPRPIRTAARHPGRAGLVVRGALRRPGPWPQAAVAPARLRRRASPGGHGEGRCVGRGHRAPRGGIARRLRPRSSTTATGRSAGSRERTCRPRGPSPRRWPTPSRRPSTGGRPSRTRSR